MMSSKSSTPPASSKGPDFSTSKKDRDKKPGYSGPETQGTRGKAGRGDIRQEARRVNVPRQSRRQGERSR